MNPILQLSSCILEIQMNFRLRRVFSSETLLAPSTKKANVKKIKKEMENKKNIKVG